jgi:hypothetical protein
LGTGSVMLEFSLPGPEWVGFEMLDLQGRRVASRPAAWHAAGRNLFTWDGLRLQPGCYQVRMTLGTGAWAKRMWVVLR